MPPPLPHQLFMEYGVDITKFKTMLADNVIGNMISYMGFFEEDEECPFTKEDVAKCETILTYYLESLAALSDPTDEKIMVCVQEAVLALNQLNEDTDYGMIETEERENIWALIQTSAVECGLQNYSDDITEEWREW